MFIGSWCLLREFPKPSPSWFFRKQAAKVIAQFQDEDAQAGGGDFSNENFTGRTVCRTKRTPCGKFVSDGGSLGI